MAVLIVLCLMLTSQAVWLGTRMTLASAASTDGPGHNDSSSSTGSGQPGVTPFVCVHCTSTGQLSSCSLQVFLNQGAVRRHCQSGQLQNLNYMCATVTPALRPLAGPGLPSQGPPGQVTRKVRGALWGTFAGCLTPAAMWRCRAVQWFLYIIFVKESSSTDTFTLAA